MTSTDSSASWRLPPTALQADADTNLGCRDQSPLCDTLDGNAEVQTPSKDMHGSALRRRLSRSRPDGTMASIRSGCRMNPTARPKSSQGHVWP